VEAVDLKIPTPNELNQLRRCYTSNSVQGCRLFEPNPTIGAVFSLYLQQTEFDAQIRLGDVKLVPGMPVEVFVRTHDRTALSYLIRPVHDQVTRAFREK
jgi:hypothetical protein